MKKIAFICLFLFASLNFALAEEKVTPIIQEKVDQVINILKDPNYKDPAQYPKMRQELEDVVLTIFDFNEMSARTVGLTWKNMTADEQSQITEAFKDLLRASYLDQVTAFEGVEVKYIGERMDSTGKVEVQTLIVAQGKSYPVNYRLMKKNDTWLVYDVIITEISLIKNYREQFQDLLAKGSAQELITKLNEKVLELKNAKEKVIVGLEVKAKK